MMQPIPVLSLKVHLKTVRKTILESFTHSRRQIGTGSGAEASEEMEEAAAASRRTIPAWFEATCFMKPSVRSRETRETGSGSLLTTTETMTTTESAPMFATPPPTDAPMPPATDGPMPPAHRSHRARSHATSSKNVDDDDDDDVAKATTRFAEAVAALHNKPQCDGEDMFTRYIKHRMSRFSSSERHELEDRILDEIRDFEREARHKDDQNSQLF